jgi:hypothetical protein
LPSGDHDGTLMVPCPHEHLGQDGDGAATSRQEPQHDVFVFGVARDVGRIREEDDPFAVGRRVGKPIVPVVVVTCAGSAPSAFMRQIFMRPLRSELK